MAQLHAQEFSRSRPRLEQWGALFDRTESATSFNAPLAATLQASLHVGDRTGLEMIRTLQDRGVQQGIDVYMDVRSPRLLTTAARDGRLCLFGVMTGRFIVFKAKSIVIATGGIGKSLACHFQSLGIHWRRAWPRV